MTKEDCKHGQGCPHEFEILGDVVEQSPIPSGRSNSQDKVRAIDLCVCGHVHKDWQKYCDTCQCDRFMPHPQPRNETVTQASPETREWLLKMTKKWPVKK